MIKLLVVDDSNIIRSRIERIYADDASIEVVAKARNGKEAVKIMREIKPDLVTMDLTMPEMDGVECITNMIKVDPTINILVVSALSDKETGIEALAKGARGFLYKPFTDEALLSALQRVINSKKKKR